jgi:hypothetical protein
LPLPFIREGVRGWVTVHPMHFTASQTYVIPRTEFVSERTVRK